MWCLITSRISTSVWVNTLSTIVLIASTTKCGGMFLIAHGTNLKSCPNHHLAWQPKHGGRTCSHGPEGG